MRRLMVLLLGCVLMLAPTMVRAEEATVDRRYPVPVSPEDSVRQKQEMRNNLVALRMTLASLASRDFAGVEAAVRGLSHQDGVATRPGFSTAVFQDLEKQFQSQVDKTIKAARTQQLDLVLRELGETMAYCQSCHAAFRQSVGSAAPAGAGH